MRIRRWAVACLLGGGILWSLAGCGGAALLDTPYAGQTRVYEPGQPNFDLLAVADVDEGRTGVTCFVGVPHASLVFVPHGTVYAARFEVLYRVRDAEGKRVLDEVVRRDTVRVARYDATQAFDPFQRRHWLPAAPGTYVIEVTLTDAESRLTARRRQRVEVPAPGTAPPVLTPLRLDGRRLGQPQAPVLSRHVPAGLDSLRATTDLFNAGALGPLQVTTVLVRFPSDTTAAAPPYYYKLSPFFGLVDYDAPDTLQATRRRLAGLDDDVTVSFDLPVLNPGLYRLSLAVRRTDASAEAPPVLHQQRDFAVRRPGFPRLVTLDEMIEALTYIATPSELEPMLTAATAAERKQHFDAFWGKLVANRRLAANLLKLYVARLEEANLRYTTFKEGWKTDRGMIFILFGPPLYVDWTIEREVWHYSYDEQDPVTQFVFERRLLYGSEGLFEAYALQRGAQHEPEWRQARERWRRGEML